MTKFGIGIGRNTHTVVAVSQEQGQEPEVTERFVPNDHSGAMDVAELVSANGSPKQVVFCGNVRWGTPFAAMLRELGIEPLYYRFMAERGKRGKVGNVAKSLVTILTAGALARPYLLQKQELPDEAELIAKLPNTHRVALEYLEATDAVRQAKHHVLDGLVLLFPEAVRTEQAKKGPDGEALPVPEPQPPGLFTKGMERVLENPDPFALATDLEVPDAISTLAACSLGRYVPEDYREQVAANYQRDLRNYYVQLARKQGKMEELRALMEGHSLLAEYRDGDIITVIAALIGWRKWPHWRELRRYAGLDVSRIDSTNAPRISRVRPPIRQYLYLFMTMTTAGKEIAARVSNTREDGSRRPHLRVKRLEKVLKTFWRTCLKE